MARQKSLQGESIRLAHDPPTLAKRIANLIRVWNVQIIEVLGASGFKDIKKTVGEENRLLIFDDLEERIYDIFKNEDRLGRNRRSNQSRIEREGDGYGWRYSQLKNLIQPAEPPHRFYKCDLKPSCYRIFDRDHVWPASLIASVAAWPAAIERLYYLATRRNAGTSETALISFKFSSRKSGYPHGGKARCRVDRPSHLASTATEGTFHGGRDVDWVDWPGNLARPGAGNAHPRDQMDTGEGGYPTIFVLDSKWNPLDLTDQQVALLAESWKRESSLLPKW